MPIVHLKYAATIRICLPPGNSNFPAQQRAVGASRLSASPRPRWSRTRTAVPPEPCPPTVDGVARLHRDFHPLRRHQADASSISRCVVSLCSSKQSTLTLVRLTNAFSDCQHVPLAVAAELNLGALPAFGAEVPEPFLLPLGGGPGRRASPTRMPKKGSKRLQCLGKILHVLDENSLADLEVALRGRTLPGLAKHVASRPKLSKQRTQMNVSTLHL